MSIAAVKESSPEFERTPPQDLNAEMSTLGGMLLSPEAIADVVEILRSNDFYRPAHQLVYDAIIDLFGRGEPADAITVAAELTRRGDIARVGGAPYLHSLVASVPTAANAGFYARIVADRAILRRLVEAGTKIVQMGFSQGEGADVDETVDRAQAEIYAVTERRTSEDYLPLSDLMQPTLMEIEAIEGHDGTLTGVPTGFSDLDALTNGLHAGQLIVVAARPAIGKSTVGLDFARAASIKNGLTSVIFSLEMSRSEITMRLLSAESRVSLGHMRGGKMSEDDWLRLARRMGEVSSAPLFIDDSPNLTMMEIRAKARRLKQRHDLRLIVLDYLQLMSSPRKVENRQQEVSEISRACKLLAKELEIPVVAISQLNRGSEQRADKRPQLSDMRESGCLTAATRVLRADTGAEVTLGSLLESGARDVPVWALDDSLRYVKRTMTHVFSNGVKEVFRLRMASGREVEATANHPFLTVDGWKPLGSLEVGSRLAAPRHVPAPSEESSWEDEEVVLLAHLLAGGRLTGVTRCWYTSRDEDSLAIVTDAATFVGASVVEVDGGLELEVGPALAGQLGFGEVPDDVFALPKRQITLFLRHLWSAGGQVFADGVSLCSSDQRLLEQVSLLLLRYGITGVVTEGRLDVIELDSVRRFVNEIGVYGEAAEQCQLLSDVVASMPEPAPVDDAVWDEVRSALAGPRPPAGERMGGVVAVLDRVELDVVATNDVAWDEIVSVESIGMHEVYDATVLGSHNFIANGIAVHNSIEQDADVVILLHREDAYEKESPRAGEADFIVAKHRNGPTGTITVAFQGHYSRFVDMQNG